MQNLDSIFFEEYKRLDNLCKDMFTSNNGVTEYINQMELSSYKGKYKVPNWDKDYKMLKHLRWIRNQIAHNSGSFSNQEDLDNLQAFYKRIFDLNDPLAKLRIVSESENNQNKNMQNDYIVIQSNEKRNLKDNNHNRKSVFVPLGIVLLVAILFFYFIKLFLYS